MTTRKDQDKVEAYARALLDAARQQGRANADLVQVNHALKFTPEVLETLTAMRASGDTELFDEVAERYKSYIEADDRTVSVTITTSVPLDDKLRAKVMDMGKDFYGVPIYLVERVDPKIIGGVVLEALGHRYDASVRAQLANIRKTLASAYIGSED